MSQGYYAASKQRNVNYILAGAIVAGLTTAAFGVFWLIKSNEEKRLRQGLSRYFTSDTLAKYQEKSLLTRIRIAETTIPIIKDLETTGWEISLTGLTQEEHETPEFIYAVNLGRVQLKDCRFSAPEIQPAGSCTQFTHESPSYEITQNAGNGKSKIADLDVYTGNYPHAMSASPAALHIGYDGDLEARGKLKIDDAGILVRDAAVLVRDPVRTSTFHEVPVADFQYLDSPVLYATRAWDYHVVYDMPDILAPFFDDDKHLTVTRLEAAFRVDLRRQTGFIMEGRITLLNKEVGHGRISYYPNQFSSIYIDALSIPGPLPDLCFNVRNALAEVDFRENRLRIGGTAELSSAESFSCILRGNGDMNFLTRGLLTSMFGAARESFDLPPTMRLRAHAVLDWDDRILCGDLDFDGRSLVHAAYVGADERLFFWAPKTFVSRDVSPTTFLSSAVQVGWDMWNAEWAFPPTQPWKCWHGDSGPQTDLFESILPDGRLEVE